MPKIRITFPDWANKPQLALWVYNSVQGVEIGSHFTSWLGIPDYPVGQCESHHFAEGPLIEGMVRSGVEG